MNLSACVHHILFKIKVIIEQILRWYILEISQGQFFLVLSNLGLQFEVVQILGVGSFTCNGICWRGLFYIEKLREILLTFDLLLPQRILLHVRVKGGPKFFLE
jgi:hypothetical protein